MRNMREFGPFRRTGGSVLTVLLTDLLTAHTVSHGNSPRITDLPDRGSISCANCQATASKVAAFPRSVQFCGLAIYGVWIAPPLNCGFTKCHATRPGEADRKTAQTSVFLPVWTGGFAHSLRPVSALRNSRNWGLHSGVGLCIMIKPRNGVGHTVGVAQLAERRTVAP